MSQRQKIKELQARNLQLENMFNQALKEIEDLKSEVARLTEYGEEMEQRLKYCELLYDTKYDD